jgi:hypothetical protein
MINKSYLDELDSLLDKPSDNSNVIDIPAASLPEPSHQTTASAAATNAINIATEARDTWASIIESTAFSMQESARAAQDVTQKNIELAKSQHDNIKELVDATSGWRHATRQAVQEVVSAKKNIIILTVISGVIALAGFGTTIGVMLQSRAGLAAMSNAVLENVDEHQTVVSRTLTLKMDEMAATIERMEASINQVATKDDDKVVTKAAKPAPEKKPDVTEVALEPRPVVATHVTNEKENVLNKQMNDTLSQVTGQLAQLEQNWKQSDSTLQKQLAQLPSAVDEKIAPRLQKIAVNGASNTTNHNTTTAPNSSTVATSQDNRIVLEQLTRLRQDLAEIRQLQTSLKDQINQFNQSKTQTYQYRTPEPERYPH